MATLDAAAAGALLQSVQQAAQAAAQAALALKESNERRGNNFGFSEATKVVQCPKEFGSAVSSEDQTSWSDFAFAFKQWLFFADPLYEPDIKHVEDHPGVVVTFHESPAGLATQERARKLYLILGGILKHRPLKVLRQVSNNNGLEAWRQLGSIYMPKTKGRSLALLSAIMQFPVFGRDRSILEQVQNLERLADEYTKSAGHDVAPDILLSTLVRVLPKEIQRHIQLTMGEDATYAQVREQVLGHERIASTWSRDRVMADIGASPLGAVTSYSTGDSGAAPMEVNQVKGKSKGKSKNAFGKAKGKGKPVFPKGKGKSKSDKGKGKNSNGKGYGENSKGQQKGSFSGKVDANTCSYCGKAGHWQKDCYKKKNDMQVRQVEEADPKDTAHNSGTAGSTTAVRAIQMLETSTTNLLVEDLTVFSQPSSSDSPFRVNMIEEVRSCHSAVYAEFDMTCTDHDQCWTICPDLSACCCIGDCSTSAFQHVRVVIDELSDETCEFCDVILDSGADTSVLPLHFSDVGQQCASPSTTFVDAQGCPLAVSTTRVATLQFGNVAFKEKFIVADVTMPLIALGHIIKSGWSLIQGDAGPCLVKGNNTIPVHYRNNSLCARSAFSMVSEVKPEDALPSVRVVQLGIVLRTLAGDWNKLSPHLFAIRTTLPKYVDTTMAPADELMWLRTTLVCRDGSGWELMEFCEAIGELPGAIDEEILFPETVIEVITLAHKYAMPAENLGFFMPDYGLGPSLHAAETLKLDASGKAADDADSGYEPSIAEDPPAEAPQLLMVVNLSKRTGWCREIQMRQWFLLMAQLLQSTVLCVHFEQVVTVLVCQSVAANRLV